MAQKAVIILRRNISEDFPDDEIDRIALHFLNAKSEELGTSHQDKEDKKDIIQSVEVVLHQAGVKRNRHNQNFYDRFMIHLTYLINRLYEEGTTDASLLDPTLEAHVKEHYRFGKGGFKDDRREFIYQSCSRRSILFNHTH